MGIVSAGNKVADALFSPVQQRVLGLLFGQPRRRFQSAELIRSVGSGTGAVHRVLVSLTDAGLLVATREGNQKYYQANESNPVCGDLCRIIDKTIGYTGPIANALRQHARRIVAAFIYRAAGRRQTQANDVDMIVITDTIDAAQIDAALRPAASSLGRRINVVTMTTAEWTRALGQPVSLVSRIYSEPRIFVIGTEPALQDL